MKYRTRLVVSILALVALAGSLSLSSASAGSSTGRPRYLALGDSATYGRRASDPATTAYVPLLANHLATVLSPGNAPTMPIAAKGNFFGTANIARLNDETTADMLAEGQLDEAAAILRQHNQNPSSKDDVQVVTFTIGANDIRSLLTNPACAPTPTPACQAAIQQALATTQANLQVIMSTLRDAAGPDTVIATMTYYYPLQGACTPPGALAVLAPQVLAALNNIITLVAGQNGILVAPGASIGIGVGDLYGDCIHLNDSGYAKLAQAFQSVIDPALQ